MTVESIQSAQFLVWTYGLELLMLSILALEIWDEKVAKSQNDEKQGVYLIMTWPTPTS